MSKLTFLILDFSKAFDTVPHERLLQKISHYGVRGCTHGWIKKWLTERTQRVVVDGEASDWVPVSSGVPQGTVLGPLMFLLYINDINDGVSSTVRLFADDCLVYRVIKTAGDALNLQADLDKIAEWAQSWQMKFNVKKCNIIRCSRAKSPIVRLHFGRSCFGDKKPTLIPWCSTVSLYVMEHTD